MTTSITVADVGHGNSALVQDAQFAALIDVAPGGIPRALLHDFGVTRVNEIIISHADEDHIGGLPSILREFRVDRVWINGDPTRSGRVWDQVRAALRMVETQGRTVIRGSVDAGVAIRSPAGRVELIVLAPAGWNLLYGTGETPPGGKKNTSNSLSAIVAVRVDASTQVILPGDAGVEAFDYLDQQGSDLGAAVLVFPHHGGRAGGDEVTFADSLGQAVAPEVVAFSVGRSRRGFPRQEIVETISRTTSAHVACTQLSVTCSNQKPGNADGHLAALPAMGKTSGSCCAGTLHLDYSAPARNLLPILSEHSAFIATSVPTPMCRR